MFDIHKEKYNRFLKELKSGKAILIIVDDRYNIYDYIDERLDAGISENKVLPQVIPGNFFIKTGRTILKFFHKDELQQKQQFLLTFGLTNMPVTRSDQINKFLYELKLGKAILITEDDPYCIDDFIEELMEIELVKKEGSFYRLTGQGILLTNAKQKYEDYKNDITEPYRANPLGLPEHTNNKKFSLKIGFWVAAIIIVIMAFLELYFKYYAHQSNLIHHTQQRIQQMKTQMIWKTY
ncbi:hypothetical protein [Mucilaginibacter sp. UYCu711]|uniref:hypothetical protein n=1 Tax=Mucilaginibacter sp. UYCu711 TaxID=3156339 RepID=UPI003D206FD0